MLQCSLLINWRCSHYLNHVGYKAPIDRGFSHSTPLSQAAIFLRPVRWMVLCVFSNWIARIPKATAFPRWVRWRFPNGGTPIAGCFFFKLLNPMDFAMVLVWALDFLHPFFNLLFYSFLLYFTLHLSTLLFPAVLHSSLLWPCCFWISVTQKFLS